MGTRVGFGDYKLLIERGAAVGLAAALFRVGNLAHKRVAAIATNGNVDATASCKALLAANHRIPVDDRHRVTKTPLVGPPGHPLRVRVSGIEAPT